MPRDNNKFRLALDTRTLVCDGAMGTMLQQNGLIAGECSEEWNLSHANVVREIHAAYCEAGADIIETNTFGGNRARLNLHGLGSQVLEFNRRAVELARSVCQSNKFIAASIGPTGEFLEPMGTATYETLIDIFSEQISALLSAGVDLIIVETMSDVNEVRAAATATRKINSDVPLILSMTFEKSPAGFFTMMGITPEQAVRALEKLSPDAIGANCSSGAPEMIELMKIFRSLTSLPLIAQANAGKPVLKGNEYYYTETPAERGEYARKLLDINVGIIGGCCGTTPAHIQAIRAAVDTK